MRRIRSGSGKARLRLSRGEVRDEDLSPRFSSNFSYFRGDMRLQVGNELRDFLACLLKKIWHFTEEYFDSLQGTERGIMSRPQNVFPPMAHYYI